MAAKNETKTAKKEPKPPKKREFSLDIFNTMRQADKNNLRYYDELTPAERKGFAPLVLMRWLSAVSNDSSNADHYVVVVNDIVNVGFFDLAKYPDLQWKLMAACGSGVVERHEWIPGPKKVTTTKFDDLILQINPSLNNLELKLAKNKFTRTDLQRLCRDFAMDDGEANAILKEFEAYQKHKTNK